MILYLHNHLLLSKPFRKSVNRHAKLSRVEWKTALKSIHSEMINYRHFAGELWSDRDGYNCRNRKATFCQQGKYQFDSTIVKVIAYYSQEAFKDGSWADILASDSTLTKVW